MLDSAEPLSGWKMLDVFQTDNGSAVNDLYGKLFVHICSVLLSFLRRLSSAGVNFELYHMNATELLDVLTPSSFARIDVRFTQRTSVVIH